MSLVVSLNELLGYIQTFKTVHIIDTQVDFYQFIIEEYTVTLPLTRCWPNPLMVQ